MVPNYLEEVTEFKDQTCTSRAVLVETAFGMDEMQLYRCGIFLTMKVLQVRPSVLVWLFSWLIHIERSTLVNINQCS
jgi:hypothetical protein